eukprot:7721674-Heterocapsa_arctica.AAC.1
MVDAAALGSSAFVAPALGTLQTFTFMGGVAAPRPALAGGPAEGAGRGAAAVGVAVGAVGAAAAVKGR